MLVFHVSAPFGSFESLPHTRRHGLSRDVCGKLYQKTAEIFFHGVSSFRDFGHKKTPCVGAGWLFFANNDRSRLVVDYVPLAVFVVKDYPALVVVNIEFALVLCDDLAIDVVDLHGSLNAAIEI